MKIGSVLKGLFGGKVGGCCKGGCGGIGKLLKSLFGGGCSGCKKSCSSGGCQGCGLQSLRRILNLGF